MDHTPDGQARQSLTPNPYIGFQNPRPQSLTETTCTQNITFTESSDVRSKWDQPNTPENLKSIRDMATTFTHVGTKITRWFSIKPELTMWSTWPPRNVIPSVKWKIHVGEKFRMPVGTDVNTSWEHSPSTGSTSMTSNRLDKTEAWLLDPTWTMVDYDDLAKILQKQLRSISST